MYHTLSSNFLLMIINLKYPTKWYGITACFCYFLLTFSVFPQSLLCLGFHNDSLIISNKLWYGHSQWFDGKSHDDCLQIQTVKTQEMNLLREQQEALTAELQQRRAEFEALLAQRDDLNVQLQVVL